MFRWGARLLPDNNLHLQRRLQHRLPHVADSGPGGEGGVIGPGVVGSGPPLSPRPESDESEE
eukprot:6836614-Prorocentrum_lima.AAC.1